MGPGYGHWPGHPPHPHHGQEEVEESNVCKMAFSLHASGAQCQDLEPSQNTLDYHSLTPLKASLTATEKSHKKIRFEEENVVNIDVSGGKPSAFAPVTLRPSRTSGTTLNHHWTIGQYWTILNHWSIEDHRTILDHPEPLDHRKVLNHL